MASFGQGSSLKAKTPADKKISKGHLNVGPSNKTETSLSKCVNYKNICKSFKAYCKHLHLKGVCCSLGSAHPSHATLLIVNVKIWFSFLFHEKNGFFLQLIKKNTAIKLNVYEHCIGLLMKQFWKYFCLISFA